MKAQSIGASPSPLPVPPPKGYGWKLFGFGAVCAMILQSVVGWLSVSPVWEWFFGRFVWNRGQREPAGPDAPAFKPNSNSTALVLYSDSAESVEWVNMCWRKASPCSDLPSVFAAGSSTQLQLLSLAAQWA